MAQALLCETAEHGPAALLCTWLADGSTAGWCVGCVPEFALALLAGFDPDAFEKVRAALEPAPEPGPARRSKRRKIDAADGPVPAAGDGAVPQDLTQADVQLHTGEAAS